MFLSNLFELYWHVTKSTPAFVGSQTAANCRVFWLSGLLTADVGPVDGKLSGCLVVGPVDGRCRARQRQMSGPSTANCLVVWLSGLSTADVGPVDGKLSGCLVVGLVDSRCRVVKPTELTCTNLTYFDLN